jgi:hypothetical protein
MYVCVYIYIVCIVGEVKHVPMLFGSLSYVAMSMNNQKNIIDMYAHFSDHEKGM